MDVLSYLFNMTICLTRHEKYIGLKHLRAGNNKTSNISATHPDTGAMISGDYACSRHECLMLDMDQRCEVKCCAEYCCLPDGPLPYSQGSRFLLGLSSLQIVGIVIGSIALLVIIVSMVMLIAKHFVPKCGNFHFAFASDRQVLVIEGPEDGDSYMEEEYEDDDDEEDELHHVETA